MTGNRKLKTVAALALILCVFMCASAAAAERKCNIAIVKSWDLPDYNAALEGFFEVMDKAEIKCNTSEFNLKGKVEGMEELAAQIRASKPDAIVTVGSRATSVISQEFDDIPIVFVMVLYPVASEFVPSMERPGKNLTGAAMDVPIKRQLLMLSEIVPKLKRIGVLYSPEETKAVVDEARRVAESMNLELLAEEIHSESDVAKALRRLDKQEMDALWSVADGKVFSSQSVKYIIKYVVRRGIPFMGPHSGFVRAGALVALTADYRVCGRQAGEIVVRILDGTKPESIAVAAPRTVKMGLNLLVARHIDLQIPQEIIDKADEVIE
jgi:putative ABC transport system substrate-binding protein